MTSDSDVDWEALDRPLEAPIEDPKVVLGSGYSEAKWVGGTLSAGINLFSNTK